MDSVSELRSAIDQLESLLRLSSSIGDEAFVDDRKSALQVRRRITDQNNKIMSLAENAFSDVMQQQAFRQHASALRAEVSSHLSAWPISSIDVTDSKYLASLERLRQAYREFISSTRAALRRS